ncbi:CynX/NimT family MFS transporter [Roseobacter litoralis]|uniref:MFS-type transporter n=1 Tax=Roseobacter litoralis (strain ATCC 49566 / DSM 6996 / JCM 21268 / NBRC 15278 / OCh 149) TaxID=391595 RepID=F7ZG39_ROSLO|nr:MFS transporter [Roseobacter litoralis]AEI94770.1 putative MFS-type transporter [Roseobacter litoralis Och 149]
MTRWHILSLLFLARTALGFQFQTLASVGDDLVVVFGLDYAGIGLLIGLFMAPGVVLALPAGLWGRYVSDRNMVGFGLIGMAVGGGLSSLAAGGWGLGTGRVVAGIGCLFAMIYFTKMVADWFEGREIATAMSILVMSWPFGIAMGQIGHAWLSQAYCWQVPFQVASAYCLIAGVGIYLFYRPPHDLPHANGGKRVAMTAQEWRLVICAAAAWGVFNAAYVTYLAFAPKVLEGHGQSAIAAAGIISIGSWIMIFSGAACGQIVDRFGGRNIVLAVCMGGAIAALLLLNLPGAGFGASLLFGLIGMAPAGVIMAMAGQAMRPQVRAFGMGIFFTVYYAIMLFTPPVAGAILDATGNAQGPMWLAMVLFATVVPLGIAFQFFKGAPMMGQERKV